MWNEGFRQNKGFCFTAGDLCWLRKVQKHTLVALPSSSRVICTLGRVQGLSLVGGPCQMLCKDEALVVTKCKKLLLLVNILEGDREILQANTVVSK